MFETSAAVLVLVVFLVPGYFWRTVEGQLVYLDRRLAWEKLALGLLTRSTIVYLPWSPLLYHGWKEKWYDTRPILTALLAMFFLVALPALLGFAFGLAKQKAWLARAVQAVRRFASQRGWAGWMIQLLNFRTFEQHHIPTAWDSLFTMLKPCFVIVTLKTGKQIRGFLSKESHISSDPEDRDLYVSHAFVQKAPNQWEIVKNTRGVYVSADEISSIEFIDK